MPIKIQRDDQSSINLTPMIDIVFLLMIFFMVGTKYNELNESERDIALQVPTVSGAEALTTAPRKRIINVYEDGQIVMDSQTLTLEQLEQELRAARKQYRKLGVVVRGAGEGKYQNVASVIAMCKKVEISDLSISVRTVKRR